MERVESKLTVPNNADPDLTKAVNAIMLNLYEIAASHGIEITDAKFNIADPSAVKRAAQLITHTSPTRN